MTAINQNDSFYAKNKRTLEFTISNYDVNPPVLYNLLGSTARWSLSRQYDDGTYSATPQLVKTTQPNGGIEIDDNPASGILTVTLLSDDTTKLLGLYHHELEIIDDHGDAAIVATGKITILRNIKN